MTQPTRPPSNTRPVVFAPGDRVRMRVYTGVERQSPRHGVVRYLRADGLYDVELTDGQLELVGPDALTLLPPAKTRGPGAGRPTTTGRVRVGNVINVYRTGPGGAALLLSGTVEAVEDTADGLRVELAGEGGSGMVVVR